MRREREREREGGREGGRERERGRIAFNLRRLSIAKMRGVQ